MRVMNTRRPHTCVLSIRGDVPIGEFEIDQHFTTDVDAHTQRRRVVGFVRRISMKPGHIIRSVEWGGTPLDDPAIRSLIHPHRGERA
jgi:hypothetical protein